jgi:hypothetical protein
MKSLLFLSLAFLSSLSAKEQYNYLSNIEPAIGLSRAEFITYMKSILNGKAPTLASNSQSVYTVQNVDMQSEYNIDKDSCLQAGIKFLVPVYYKIAEKSIISNYPPVNEYPTVYYKIAHNGKTIYYIVNEKKMVIVLIEKQFFIEQEKALNHN